MNKQMRLSAFSDELAQVRTKKKEFLEQINRIIPWGEWIALMQREHQKSSVRAKVEHAFAVVKGLLKFKKPRYRALRKRTAKFNLMFALANLNQADRPCLAA